MDRHKSEFRVGILPDSLSVKYNIPKSARRATFDLCSARRVRTPATYKEFFSGTSKKLLKQTEGMEAVEIDFLQRYRELFKQIPVPFVEMLPSSLYLANRASDMKRKKSVPLPDTVPLHTIVGPDFDRGIEFEPPQIYEDQVCAQTISTYPLKGQIRQGDPICDRYGFKVYENRSICVVADGCNWGERPKYAAAKCRDAVLDYLSTNLAIIKDVQEAQSHLLRSLIEGQRAICAEDPNSPGPGSTTLFAGLYLEILGASGSPNEWVFVCVSVGDCKAFLIEHDTLKVRDVTMDNRTKLKSENDCGGRLGAVINNTSPDLRNLRTYSVQCQPQDIIIVVSDGVHDNLHPQMLAVSPKELKLDFDSWKEAEKVIDVEEVATKFRVQHLQHFITDFQYTPTPHNLVTNLISHCQDITKNSREFMQTNPGQILPSDYQKYPGKMDHTTCVAFRVGRASWFKTEKAQILNISPTYTPLSVSVYSTPETVRVCCRTIAKGKFECVAKKKSCVLKVKARFPFAFGDEEILETNEISEDIRREITFPPGVSIAVHSKQISFCAETGVISIKFDRI